MKLQSSRIIILVLIGALFLSVSSIYAETIILKSGKTIEGKILERNEKAIKVEIDGMSWLYFLKDIESIDGEKINLSSNMISLTEGTKEDSLNLPSGEKECFEKATLFIKKGQYSEAIKELKKVGSENLSNISVSWNIGVAYACVGQYNDAIQQFNMVLKSVKGDDSALLWFNLGSVYEKLNEFSKAAASYQSALEILPGFGIALSRLFVISEKGKINGLNADTLKERLQKTTVLFTDTDPENDIKTAVLMSGITEIIKEYPIPFLFLYHSPMSYVSIGSAYENEYSFDEANSVYLKALNLDLGNLNLPDRFALSYAYKSIGNYKFKKRDLDGAEKDTLKSLEFYPDNPAVLANLGIIYYFKGKFMESKELAEKVIRLIPFEDNPYHRSAKTLLYKIKTLDSTSSKQQ